MKKYFLIGVLSALMLAITTPLQAADQWVDVGPTSMPLSDLKVLQQMVERGTSSTDPAQPAKPEMVNVGMASMPRSEFFTLAGLVNGEIKIEKNSHSPKKQLIDLGIVTIEQAEMETLSRMVQKGLLQHWYAGPNMDLAAH